jgi:hypothetical protein
MGRKGEINVYRIWRGSLFEKEKLKPEKEKERQC